MVGTLGVIGLGGAAYYGGYKLSATPTTRFVVRVLIVSILYDEILMPDDYDYGLIDLGIASVIASGWTALVN